MALKSFVYKDLTVKNYKIAFLSDRIILAATLKKSFFLYIKILCIIYWWVELKILFLTINWLGYGSIC